MKGHDQNLSKLLFVTTQTTNIDLDSAGRVWLGQLHYSHKLEIWAPMLISSLPTRDNPRSSDPKTIGSLGIAAHKVNDTEEAVSLSPKIKMCPQESMDMQ